MVRVEINNVRPGVLKQASVDGKSYALSICPEAQAFSHKGSRFITLATETTNALVAAVHTAFAHHIPLELSPDAIFNTILQGIAAHVSTNPEHFRGVFVAHARKKGLVTRNDALVMGSWENNWEVSIADLGKQILQDMSGDAAKGVLSTGFTTTTLAEATAHTAAFMDIVKHYYDYTFVTMCGIPYIDILGEREDWVKLGKAIGPLLCDLGLSAWNKEVQEIMSHFVGAFDGKVDWEHWNRIYNHHGPDGSGDVAKVSGWIAKLFLYVKGGLNPLVGKGGQEDIAVVPQRREPRPEFASCPWKDEALWGPKASVSPLRHQKTSTTAIPLAHFPAGLSNTPFTWMYWGREYKMKLIAGVVGVSVSTSGHLKPEVGWIVASATGTLSLQDKEKDIAEWRSLNTPLTEEGGGWFSKLGGIFRV